MALQFPSNPNIDQVYQTGSLPAYRFNGRVWEVAKLSRSTNVHSISSSYAEDAVRVSFVQNTVSASISETTNHIPGYSITEPAASASYAATSSLSVGSPQMSEKGLIISAYLDSDSAIIGTPNVVRNISNWTPEIEINTSDQFNYRTGIFRAKKAGTYLITFTGKTGNFTDSLGKGVELRIVKNGFVQYSSIHISSTNYENDPIPQAVICGLVEVVEGDSIQVAVQNQLSTGKDIVMKGTKVSPFATTLQIRQIK